jgi:hypothetical protein
LVALAIVNPTINLASVGRNALARASQRGSRGHPIIYR